MKEENKHIGDIFKAKLQNQRIPIENEEWDDMAMKLNKMRFFSFSFSHFNIYYCTLIISCFLFSSASFIKAFFYEEQKIYSIEEKQSANRKNTASYPIDSSAIKNKTESLKLNPKSDNKSIYKKNDNVSAPKPENNTNTIISTTLSQKDTIIPADTISNKNIIKPVKKKKIVHIIKQDTIVIDETPVKQKTNRRK